jgi:hypothetical protein
MAEGPVWKKQALRCTDTNTGDSAGAQQTQQHQQCRQVQRTLQLLDLMRTLSTTARDAPRCRSISARSVWPLDAAASRGDRPFCAHAGQLCELSAAPCLNCVRCVCCDQCCGCHGPSTDAMALGRRYLVLNIDVSPSVQEHLSKLLVPTLHGVVQSSALFLRTAAATVSRNMHAMPMVTLSSLATTLIPLARSAPGN